MDKLILLLLISTAFVVAQAKVVLPSYITDNMVVQRNSVMKITGHASSGSKVNVIAGWDSRSCEVKADSEGKFDISLDTPDAGGPYSIIIADKDSKVKVGNVLSGELWLCSGQSNMEFPVEGWTSVMDADHVVSTARNPDIRLLQVKKRVAFSPQDDIETNMGGWVEAAPNTMDFSAIAYLYAKELRDSLKVPVGVIDATWGGTPVEAWTPNEYLKEVQGFEFYHEQLAAGKDEQGLIDAAMGKVYEGYRNPEKMSYPYDKAVMQKGKAWGKMPVPSLWENNVLPGFDGIVVMQFELDLPATAAGKPLQLCLGAVDDWDMTYFNGKLVGSGRIIDQQRDYRVDGNLVKGGKNVITVEVIDNAGGGGIWKSSCAVVDGTRYSLDGEWSYAVLSDFSQMDMAYQLPDTPHYPSVLYNAMIAPLTGMPLAGVFWYQGCANVGRAAQYEVCFKNMIEGWRKSFDNSSLPFYFVQLAGFQQPVAVQPDSEWALLRHAQSKALQLPNTGMATAIDLGNPVGIHPANKQEVARRLSLLALDKTYGRTQACEAPRCVDTKIGKGYIDLTFDNDINTEGGVAIGFIIKDKSGKWAYANTQIVSNKTIRLSSPLINNPVAVRYNWADYPGGNLTGRTSGLPVTPFATDI